MKQLVLICMPWGLPSYRPARNNATMPIVVIIFDQCWLTCVIRCI
jgi:hypothetical protein